MFRDMAKLAENEWRKNAISPDDLPIPTPMSPPSDKHNAAVFSTQQVSRLQKNAKCMMK